MQLCAIIYWIAIDYQNVLEVLLELKSSYTILENGEFTIEIENAGIFFINVNDGMICVKRENAKDVDMKLTEREVISAFLSPAGKLYEKRSDKKRIPNWFPIEFSICNADEF